MATLRYRAKTHVVYGLAIVALFRYARQHPEPVFNFGPLDLKALDSQGLSISGPDLHGVAELLDEVPGLVEVPA